VFCFESPLDSRFDHGVPAVLATVAALKAALLGTWLGTMGCISCIGCIGFAIALRASESLALRQRVSTVPVQVSSRYHRGSSGCVLGELGELSVESQQLGLALWSWASSVSAFRLLSVEEQGVREGTAQCIVWLPRPRCTRHTPVVYSLL
jgi:hypothetical protein